MHLAPLVHDGPTYNAARTWHPVAAPDLAHFGNSCRYTLLPPTIPQLTDKPPVRSIALWIFSRRTWARVLVGGLVRGDEEGLKAKVVG